MDRRVVLRESRVMTAIAGVAGAVLLPLACAPVLAALPVGASYDDAIRCAAADMIMAGMLDSPQASDKDRAIVAHYRTLAALWLDDATRLSKDKRKVLADLEARGNAIMARLQAGSAGTDIDVELEAVRTGCAAFEQAYVSRRD